MCLFYADASKTYAIAQFSQREVFVTVQPLSKACRVFKFVAPGCVIVMAIVNGTMIPLPRMEKGCPQSGRGRGQEIVSCGGYIHGTPNGVLMHRLNSYPNALILLAYH